MRAVQLETRFHTDRVLFTAGGHAHEQFFVKAMLPLTLVAALALPTLKTFGTGKSAFTLTTKEVDPCASSAHLAAPAPQSACERPPLQSGSDRLMAASRDAQASL